MEPFDGVFVRGEELEAELDERCPFRIDGDGADLAAFKPVDDVEVAELRSTERAALAGFLAHLVADVSAVFGRAEFVEGGQDAVHQLADGCLVDALRCRYQCDLVLAQVDEHQRVIDAVSVHAGKLVDDDVVDIAFILDALEHALEGGALVHARRAASRLDVLIDDVESELFCLALARRSLGRDRQAFRVVVSLDLRWRTNAQVEHGPVASAWLFARCRETNQGPRGALVDDRFRLLLSRHHATASIVACRKYVLLPLRLGPV